MINSAPKVIVAERISQIVWASRITLEMPAGASHPTDKFILLLSHSGINDAELVPVTIHQMDDTNPCGANAIVAGQLGLTTRITQAGTGWLVTLPQSIPSGQSIQYDIVWGKIRYFGWQESVPVDTNFPNVSPVKGSYLDDSLKLWCIADKQIRFGTKFTGEANASVFMNVSNKNGPVVGETLLRYAPGSGWDGSYGRETLYAKSHIVPIGSSIALLWQDEQKEFFFATHETVQKYRCGAETFSYSGLAIGSRDGTYAEGRSIYIPTRSIGDTLWFVDCDDTTAAFWVLNSDCAEIILKTTFESFTTNDSFLNLKRPVQIGNNVLFLWTRDWYTTSHDRPREQIMYQIRSLSGNIVKTTAELSPALLNDDIDKEDKYSIDSILPDKNGKVWITYNHTQSGQSTVFYYVIIGADGSIWKGPIQTTSVREFRFCDKDGYIWATEGGQFFALNSDDSVAYGPRPPAFIPNQEVGNIAALVQSDGYRLYDCWSFQTVQIDVPIGTNDDSMELFDLNLWANDLHPANLVLKKGDTSIWDQTGQFTGHTTINVSGALNEGQNLLLMTQDEFLGGQVLVTFPYSLPQVALPEFSPDGGTYTSPVAVTISCATSGATIHYTTNGAVPTESDPVYTAPINISSTTTLKAKAWKSGWTPSGVKSADYVINQKPTISIAAMDREAAETVLGTPANTGTFRISRVGSTTSPLTIYFSRKGTAKFGSKADYTLSINGTPLTGTSVVIPAGQGYVDITVRPVDNLVAEPSETVILTLTAKAAYNLSSTISERTATVTILDNDPKRQSRGSR